MPRKPMRQCAINNCPNLVENDGDIHCKEHKKDEYKNLADGVVALLLYLDRNEYSSSYVLNKTVSLYKSYSYNKNNKYYDPDWVKNNFGGFLWKV